MAKNVKMLRISPNNHAMIISWKFHPNSISFERIIAIFGFFRTSVKNFLSLAQGVYNGSKMKKMIFFAFSYSESLKK